MQTHHGSVIDVGGVGVMLRGPSASGKSDLALRLMDRGAVLVADDRVILSKHRSGLRASAPDKLYGSLEVRGIGIMSMPAIKNTTLKLIVDLVEPEVMPRLPERTKIIVEDVEIDCLSIYAFEISAAIKVELAAQNLDQIGKVELQHG
ncbi:HPr kinase/phosphorylase [Kordiimonas aquimaris]|uniref:HPr kinase/phosphorylase n=1 Tax=Kordiimonas aquimaris TaxID=707591 RepID=UPI0021D2D030|nr:HPr kinase/phosphatase C-terminal domain-containing protein [Kordiimonas aquimaris]